MHQETKTMRAYRIIKEMILQGEVGTESMLSEHALAEQLEMSRTPVREAVQRLTHEGLVKSFSRKGTMLTDISISDATEIFEFRMAIEEFIISRLAQRLTPTHWRRIDELMAGMQQACDEMDLSRYLAIDAQFHDCFAEAYGNELIRRNLRSVRERFVAVGALIVKDNPTLKESMAGHYRIVEALRHGTWEEALAAMREHLQFGKSTLLS